MAEITLIDKRRKDKPNVCAYVRTSSNSLDQAHSFEVQFKYWQKQLGENPNVNYIGMFSDEGVSATKGEKRQGYRDMLRRVEFGDIDIIYTKSITRFGRNMIETVKRVNALLQKGIAVIFEKEGMNTLELKSKLTFNIMTRIAEEDILTNSESVKWAVKKKFANGDPVGISYAYGFNVRLENGKTYFTINEEQAAVIRLIYDLYLSGLGHKRICDELYARGIKTAQGKDRWREQRIRDVLTDVKVVGNLVLQKSYTENFIQKKNDGVMPIIEVGENHPAIIDFATFEKAQEMTRNKVNPKVKGKALNTFPFTSKIVCGDCGANFIHKVYNYKKKQMYGFYFCTTYARNAHIKCKNHSIKESVLHEHFYSCLAECLQHKQEYVPTAELEEKLEQVVLGERELRRMHYNHYISDVAFKEEQAAILKEIKELEAQIADLKKRSVVIEKPTDESLEVLVQKYIDKVVVTDWTVTFHFANGFKASRQYTNGKSGNKKGFNKKVGG